MNYSLKHIKPLLIILVGFFFACSSPVHKAENSETIVDGTGRRVEVSSHPQRVMALSPSMTELLFELVPKERIVGRTDQCDYPEACLSLPKVQVYPTVNLEKVIKLKPDVVISNTEITPLETAEKLTQLGIPVLLYDINSLDKFYATVHSMATVLGVEMRGNQLVDSLKSRVLNAGFSKINTLSDTIPVLPSCVVLISMDPIYVHGKTSFLNELLEIAGFKNAVDSTMGAYPQISRSWLLKTNPDYLLGYDFKGLDSTFFELYPELRAIKAYQNKTIYRLDADLASRPGPRFVQLIEEMRIIK